MDLWGRVRSSKGMDLWDPYYSNLWAPICWRGGGLEEQVGREREKGQAVKLEDEERQAECASFFIP